MINLSERSYRKELLDEDNIPFADIRQNMKELNTINTLLGGHQITIAGTKKLLAKHKPGQPVTICEIGCGGGDNLRAVEKWCKALAIEANFIGIDMKPECISFAKQQYPLLGAQWIISDYSKVQFDQKPDIIFASLFCHHFGNEQMVTMLQWLQANSSVGFFINDLHRNIFAYYSIKLITTVFSRSYLVKNDAPLSVARGFQKKEWQQLASRAGLSNCSVEWKWAFRYLVTYTTWPTTPEHHNTSLTTQSTSAYD